MCDWPLIPRYGRPRKGSRVLPLQNKIIWAQQTCLIFNSFSSVQYKWWRSCCVWESHVQAHHIQDATDLEFLVLKVVAPVQVLFAMIYRQPDYNTNPLMPNLCHLLDSLLHVIVEKHQRFLWHCNIQYTFLKLETWKKHEHRLLDIKVNTGDHKLAILVGGMQCIYVSVH